MLIRTAADHRLPDSETGKDLRHLRGVAKAVAQVSVSDRLSPELPCHRTARLQVADQALPGNQKFIRHTVPRPYPKPSLTDIFFQFRPLFRPDFEIILQCERIPVQQEHQLLFPFENDKQFIQNIHQPETEFLECPVPFPVPVGT